MPETPELRGILIRQHGCGSGAREKGLIMRRTLVKGPAQNTGLH